MFRTRKKTKLGAVAASAVAVPAFAAVAPADAATMPVGSPIRGVQAGDGTRLGSLTTCVESFRGRVTHDPGPDTGGTVAIDQFSYTNCTNGARVTINTRPRTLSINSIGLWMISPVDVNITTSRGTCRYTGNLGDQTGFFTGVTLSGAGSLYRKSSGCGGSSSIMATQFERLLDANGNPAPL
jgi:hypothetical protein